MKTKSTIKQELSDSLTSSGWKRLKSGLIGKELIAYGAEVISATEQVKESMVQAFKFEYADWPSLISISTINDVCVSNIEPSYIRVQLNGDYNTIYKPFDLKLKSGTSSFTNIDYCRGNDEVTLYQGVVRTSFSSSDFAELRYDQVQAWEITNVPTSESDVNQYIVLGKALPNSVRFLATSGSLVYPISRYNPVQCGPEYELYKLRTLENGNIAIMLGNDVWGKGSYPSSVMFQIFWLELTSNEFTAEGNLVNNLTEQVNFTIVGANTGSENNIEYARLSYRQEFLKTAVIASAAQIKEFIKGFSYIQDCAIVPSNNQIFAYVKPTDPDDSGSFGEIESQLDIYGNIFVKHQVILGTPVEFQFLIYNVESAVKQKEISAAILEEYAYHKLTMDFTVDPANVAAFIQSKFGITTLVRFNVEQEFAEDGYLMFYPIQGTIRITQQDKLIAWDTNGVLQGKDIDSPIVLPSLQFGLGIGRSLNNLSNSLLGHDDVVCTDPKLFSVDTFFIRNIADIINSMGLSPNTKVISTNGEVILRDNVSGLTVVCDDSMFWNYPNFAFNGVREKARGILQASEIQDLRTDEYIPYMFYINNVLHILQLETHGASSLKYYNVVDGQFNNYFSLSLPGFTIDDEDVKVSAALVNGGNLYVFFNKGQVRVVENYDSPFVQINTTTFHIANAQLVEGEFSIFRGTSSRICIIQIINEKHKVWIADGFKKDELGILFTNLVQVYKDTTGDIPELSYSTDPDQLEDYNRVFPILVTDEYVVFTRLYYADDEYKSQIFVLDVSADKSTQIKADSFYDIEDLGIVDYYNGEISYTGDATKIQYESASYKSKSSKNYMKLNTEEPIIWK